jgi:hypothetical protein
VPHLGQIIGNYDAMRTRAQPRDVAPESLDLDVTRPDHLGPLLSFRDDKLLKFGGEIGIGTPPPATWPMSAAVFDEKETTTKRKGARSSDVASSQWSRAMGKGQPIAKTIGGDFHRHSQYRTPI